LRHIGRVAWKIGICDVDEKASAAVAEWSQDVPTEGSVELPPDPRALDAIGGNHSIQTALADLIDNAIDAKATHVVVRLVQAEGQLRSLYVVDNGKGITPEVIDEAMTIGGKREYQEGDLGHFGLGLKAASFSQARHLTVMSRAAGHPVTGRRWRLDNAIRNGFRCDVVPADFIEAQFGHDWRVGAGTSGTIVRWDDVSAFPATDDSRRLEEYASNTIAAACQHLGQVFHRILASDRLAVDFEVQNVDEDFLGPPIPVTPLDPFHYPVSGRPDYPKDFVGELDGRRLTFSAHLWPKPSSSQNFRLNGSLLETQGMYFYRNDRLLQAGGWEGVHARDRKLQLARVAIEIGDGAAGLFRMNAEKSRVITGPEFARLAASAQTVEGLPLDSYFEAAREVYKTSQMRSAKRKAMIYPGTGLPPRVKKTIAQEIPALRGEAPIDIRWETFTDDSFFQIDREQHTLWLNKRYRKMLLGGKHGGLNDLPLLKSLLYLLFENMFEGDYLGPRDKDNIDLWQTVLTAAVQAERQ
jgi:hypothetical protein